PNELRAEHSRELPPRRYLCGQDIQRRETRRPAGRAAHEIRAGDQSPDCGRAWDQAVRGTAVPRGPGDRMNRRRDLLVLLGAAAVAPRTVLAQSKQARVLIGWLHLGGRNTQGHFLAAFKEALAALGWKEGVQVVIEERWADSRVERLPVLARGLAAGEPAGILAPPAPAVGAAAKTGPAQAVPPTH